MPSVPELLTSWETGLGASDPQRAVLLHALARPAERLERLLDTAVGARDADLMTLRRALFGEQVPLRIACAGCLDEMEFAVDLADVATVEPAEPAAEQRVDVDEWSLRVRPPTAGDLLTLAGTPGAQARRVLLTRCVLEATRAGRRVEAGKLPARVERRVAEVCAAADPRADVTLDVPCPECGHRTKAVLDIGAVLWAELDAWARQVLLDVHLLASAYGWTEADVFALSPLRRRYYLELAGHA